MPLFYYARQSQIATKEGVKTWHLSLKKVGKVVDTQLLAESIAEKSSLTPGDVQNVIVAEKPPELELLDSMYSMPGVPFSSCSMGVATACDTVSALAPG